MLLVVAGVMAHRPLPVVTAIGDSRVVTAVVVVIVIKIVGVVEWCDGYLRVVPSGSLSPL